MTETYARLQNLVELARETSDDRRRQLLQEVTDLFFESSDSMNEAQRGLFGDVMTRVLPDVQAEARKRLSERLAKLPGAPPDVVRWLANDEIGVAAPVLAESPALADADLLAIVESKSQEHLMSVSKRAHVSPMVSERLVDKGSDEVVESLICNQGAELTHKAFTNVAKRAETNERLQSPLVDRKDAPPDVLHQVFWSVSLDLRKKILVATAALDEKELDRLLAESEAALAAELASRANKAEDEADKFIAAKDAFGKLNLELLLDLLRQNRLDYFISGFARLARMDKSTVRHILAERNGEAASIACKALGFHWAHFTNLMLLLDRETGRQPEDRKKLVDLYNRLSLETAQRTLRFWRLRREGGRTASPSDRPKAP